MVVVETPDYWVIEKPSGISINDEAEHLGFVSELKASLGVDQLHPAHRLDKETSGLFLLAKHSDSNRALSALFQQQNLKKQYLAIVSCSEGKAPAKKQGWIRGDMKKGRNGSWMLLRSQNSPAITYFQSISIAPRTRLAILYPQTGKTHQLRVAMRSISAPILGDQRYGGEPAERMYLHSAGMEFEYQGRRVRYQSLPNWEAISGVIDEPGLLTDGKFWPARTTVA